MAIQFTKTGFSIQVESTSPIEEWLNTHAQLADLLQSVDLDLTAGNNYYHVLELLHCMMPDFDTAKKML